METPIRLLSPAGSFEIFRAVIAAGADAVYAGLKRFSARAYADNFTDEEMIRAMDEAHLRGRKFCLALNTLIKDSEMPAALSCVERLYEAGLDAVIVQDFGLAAQIHANFPQLEQHASTQMTICGPSGMRLLKNYGFTQVVVPRELSLVQIRQIAAQTDLRLECFVHGALCYSCSGKCLMSSMIGGRSANRGKCAQPCRLPYQVMRTPEAPAAGSRSGGASRGGQIRYPLSLKDLCAADLVPALIDAGVCSFKIEGRMKGLEYAAGVTRIYRELIDEALSFSGRPETGRGGLRDTRRRALEDLGSRSGFTDGYLEPKKKDSMVTLRESAHHREMGSPAAAKIREQYGKAPEKIPAEMEIRIRSRKAAALTMSAAGHTVTVTGDVPMPASSRPLDEKTVRGKLSKLGETEFTLQECRIDLEANCFLPVSQLNRLRQEAVRALVESFRPGRNAAQKKTMEKVPQSPEADAAPPMPASQPALYVSVTGREQLWAVLKEPETAAVILDCDAFPPGNEMKAAAHEIHSAGRKCVYAMPHLFLPQTASLWQEYASAGTRFGGTQIPSQSAAGEAEDVPDGFLVRNADELSLFQEIPDAAGGAVLIADAGLYAWNDSAKSFLMENGIALITVPYELSRQEMSPQNEILTVYGSAPLMVSVQCVSGNTGMCRKKSGGRGKDHPAGADGRTGHTDRLAQREDPFVFLKDRKGNRFPVRLNCFSCTNVIYNCVPTVLFSEAAQIIRMPFSGYRMDFLRETEEEIRDIFRQYRMFLKGESSGRRNEPFTYGAWKRGTQ